MSEQDDNYEDLTQCGLESELEQELLDVQRAVSYTHLTLPTTPYV